MFNMAVRRPDERYRAHIVNVNVCYISRPPLSQNPPSARDNRLSSLSSNRRWFDKECRLKRHTLRKLANLKHRDPLNITLREKYHSS